MYTLGRPPRLGIRSEVLAWFLFAGDYDDHGGLVRIPCRSEAISSPLRVLCTIAIGPHQIN
jgi:hypothetical protein